MTLKKKKEPAGKSCNLVYEGKETKEAVLATPPAPLDPMKKSYRGSIPSKSAPNLLIRGDNLATLSSLIMAKKEGAIKNRDGSVGVRLVYIDPPFSTNLTFKGRKDQKAYDDKVIGAEFLEYLRKRLILIRELMSEDGSIYCHLDWKKAHHAKIIMDEVFGSENFMNDIIWSYGGRGAKAVASQFSRNHDIILLYKKSGAVFNRATTARRIKKGTTGYHEDADGRWFKTSPRGDYTDASIKALEKEGRVYRTRTGSIRIKYFLQEDGDHLIEERVVGDVWDDIPDGMHMSPSEKTGYPTQKSEALLARIISASSNPGDIVLDAFAGAGTTLAVAERLGRRWIGIDSGHLSIHTIENRLLKPDDSKTPSGKDKKRSGACAPFIVYEVEGCCGHEHDHPEPKVRLTSEIDEKKGECTVRIKAFESPAYSNPSKGGATKGKECLSSVMLDLGFDDQCFRLSRYITQEEIQKNSYSITIPLDDIKGPVMMIFTDIYGNERWLLGELGE
ncbi:MAG: site-specific DNA-methyltransferase [Deltaproteobacteria bacterium]